MSDVDADTTAEINRLFSAEPEFLLGAARLEQVPDSDLPEVAFAGRSNVGKSSLINALLGRKDVARTSNTPGRTQQVNFFDLGGRLMLVDLPGYGFAKAPKDHVKGWTRLVNSYLKGRQQLRRTFVLIDARHGLKPSDHDVMAMLDTAAQPYQVILTKTDKISATALDKIRADVLKRMKPHVAAHPVILETSSKKGSGLTAVRLELLAFCN